MAGEFPYTVVVMSQGSPDTLSFTQPFENKMAALSCVKHEEMAGRECRLYRNESDGTRVREPILRITHIGNR